MKRGGEQAMGVSVALALLALVLALGLLALLPSPEVAVCRGVLLQWDYNCILRHC